VNWLKQASGFALLDSDRDALLASMADYDEEEADKAITELEPVILQFTDFRKSMNLAGFEGVSECGQMLADIQRPMLEIINLDSRHRHRLLYTKVIKQRLIYGGVTREQLKQMNSWFGVLTTY
jgi:hypothetical protein